MVVEATLPYGHLDDDWPGRGGRKVGKPSRALAKSANPKRGLSEAQLLELLQDTFAQYTAIAGAATVQPEASVAFRSWRAYLAWACDPTLNIKEFLAGRASGTVMTSDKDPAEEPAKGLDPAAVEAWVVASRARQGLGPKITDPATLARIAVLAHIHDKQRGDYDPWAGPVDRLVHIVGGPSGSPSAGCSCPASTCSCSSCRWC